MLKSMQRRKKTFDTWQKLKVIAETWRTVEPYGAVYENTDWEFQLCTKNGV